MKERPLLVKCVVCQGHKAVPGKSSGPYPGSPATLICPKCDGTGEVDYNNLTDLEKHPPLPVRYERDDNP